MTADEDGKKIAKAGILCTVEGDDNEQWQHMIHRTVRLVATNVKWVPKSNNAYLRS